MEKDSYLTTGELANMLGIKKHTLFHYDDIGLFSPEIRKENDYRYYSVHQFEAIETILFLKGLGMPLAEIKIFMDYRSPEKLKEVFAQEDAYINREIAALKQKRQWLLEKQKKIATLEKMKVDEIIVANQPKRYFVICEVAENSFLTFSKKTAELVQEYKKAEEHAAYEIGYLQYEEDIRKQIYGNYRNVLLLMKQKPVHLPYRVMEQGDYLTAYHVGHWDTIGEAYERLRAYAAKNEIAIEEKYLETYLLDNMMTPKLTEYITEIAVKIRK